MIFTDNDTSNIVINTNFDIEDYPNVLHALIDTLYLSVSSNKDGITEDMLRAYFYQTQLIKSLLPTFDQVRFIAMCGDFQMQRVKIA